MTAQDKVIPASEKGWERATEPPSKIPLREAFRNMIRELSPAYFAMVMATGIVSTACFMLDYTLPAFLLFRLNILFYIVLNLVGILRLALYREHLTLDLLDHARGMGFFTYVAGTCVLALQYILLTENYVVARLLWMIALFTWVVITYTIFTNLTIKKQKPVLAQGINGAWLLAIVSTQGLSILSARLSSIFTGHESLLDFFAFSMWLWGGMLYTWMISLIFYRYTFFKFSPKDLSPPYWINMGAMAISTLAGSVLIRSTAHNSFLLSVLPFIKGFTVLYWATGTWWIPILLILGFWRHVYHRLPFRYDPLYWGAVFPLGMYTVCTLEMAGAMGLEFLNPVSSIFIFIALTAWIASFYGFLKTLYKKLMVRNLLTIENQMK